MDSITEGASERLVAALAAGEPLPPGWTAEIFAVPPPAAGERPITVDQTNVSVVVGDQVVVKWIRDPAKGPHRAPAILARLAAAGFRQTAPPYAAVHRDGALVALVTGYLPDARDGWDWCVDAAMAAEPFAAALGVLAADLHLTLAPPRPSVPPGSTTPPRNSVAEPAAGPALHDGVAQPAGGPAPHDGGAEPAGGVVVRPGEAWHERAVAAAREAARSTPGEDGRWLEFRAGEFAAALRPLLAVGETPVQTIHGDLHVGQILRWRGGYAVIDFDGNPTVEGDEAQPPARDLAQLLTSLDHVAQIAIKRRGADPEAMATWAKAARREALEAYLARLAEAGRAGLFDRRLLRAFEVEQECRELIYASRYLERWRYAPMGVLRRWFG